MNNILAQLNSVPMYAICGGIIAFVAVVCVIFLVRSYRAGLAIGIDPARMKRAITSSATFSVLPSVGILLGVIALSGSLGTPWPWLRLSVIGALHYETQVAQAAAEQVGMHALSAAEMTPQGFTTIALLMSICIMWGMILSIFFNKRYLKRLGNDGARSASGVGFGDSAMTAMFIGLVCAYIGSYIGAFVSGEGLFTCTGDWTPLVVVAVSAAVMALFVYLAEKKNMAWLESFSIAGSMLIGMAAAVLVLGVALLVPLQPVLQSPVLQPAFANVVPALFGAMAYQYFRKNVQVAVAPLVVMSLLFMLVPSLTSSTSFMIIPSGALAIGIAYSMYRKQKKEADVK